MKKLLILLNFIESKISIITTENIASIQVAENIRMLLGKTIYTK